MARAKNPSNALIVGGLAGAASVPVLPTVLEAANELGVHVSAGPATLQLATWLVTTLVAYFAKGGRKGEAH